MKKIGLTILFWISTSVLYATHQKAAEITYRHVEGNRYEFLLVTYTYLPSLADRPTLPINWRARGGGGGSMEVTRTFRRDDSATLTRENHYRFEITFPGDGTYFISMEDPNRNGGVMNLPNSIATPMFVETMLVISSFIAPNSSPVLLNKPVDVGCFGIPFMHNPGAYDPDGDSLSFRLVNCRGADGLDIVGFRLPDASDSININPVTGDLIWDSPIGIGDFNIAILVEEFRRGVRIGSITRDMQITIEVCQNNPPELHVPEKLCVFAGDTLRIPVMATDRDTADILTLSATGGMLPPVRNSADSAVFAGNTGRSPVHDTLIWVPRHADVQQQPHAIFFRVRDDGRPNLNTLKTAFVQVIGPAPRWDSIVPTFESISLHWTPILDESIFGYRIYRARSESGITQDSCDFGLTDGNYQRIAELRGDSISNFVDFNVDQNFLYCYRIVTVYRNGTVSQMSEEICVIVLSNAPILEKVSVVETDENFGKIELAWRRPLDFDIASDGTNFRYVIHRLNGTNFEALDTNEIHDTTYFSERLNTQNFPHTYKIELIQWQDDSWESIGFSNPATSIFASAIGRNRRVNVSWEALQPWRAESFTVYRKMAWQSDSDFESIAHTTQTLFDDTDVVNDSTYTYKIRAFGRHYDVRINDYVLINLSQKAYATPQIDTPCIQQLEVFLNCKPLEHLLKWSCADDCCRISDLTFHIFYNSSRNGIFQKIAERPFTDFFIHENTFTGCYYVRASNIRNFISDPSDTICITPQQYYEECMDFRLPNVFTPNGDGINDEFKALPHSYSGIFRIQVFNRWGNVVFESNCPDFEWDGTNQSTGQPSPTGVYFYVAELTVPGGRGDFGKKTLSGSVTLLR